MARTTLKRSKASQPPAQPELITFRKMCDSLGQPEYKVRYQIGALNIKHEYKVGAARIFSKASFLRIKAAITIVTK